MSTLKVNVLQNFAGSKSANVADIIDGFAKAWCNWNMIGTPAIRKSFNVSGITDVAVGDQTVNFLSALADANYTVDGTIACNSSVNGTFPCVKSATQYGTASNKTTTACEILLSDYTVGLHDVAEIYLNFHD
jgi:hypothetical protein